MKKKNRRKALLRNQMKLLAETSKTCEPMELSKLTQDMLAINYELKQNPADKGKYDGEIKIKTRVDQTAVKKLFKRVDKLNKKLKKTTSLMKEIGSNK